MSTPVLLLLLSLLSATLLCLGYLIYKVRRLARLVLREVQEDLPRFVKGEIENCYQQAEALAAVLTELRLRASLPPTRNWAASPDLLRELMRHVSRHRPQTIVECGSGVSTIVLARCLEIVGTGHVYSLEHLPDQADKTREELKRQGLGAWATVLTAPLCLHRIADEEFHWYGMDGLPVPTFDMLVIDGPPATTGPLARYPAGPLLFCRLAPQAAVFLDDSNRDQEQAILSRWRKEFPRLHQDSRPCEKGCAVLWSKGDA
ncbi:MAG: class I SAM-dependent methyltransferase [Nitrospiraceae bacterium]|nr:class I SAM-dependent methyltransferase [Nitrospiraceae bacterium]